MDLTHRYERYAIYWAPEPGSEIAEILAPWFGTGHSTGQRRETFGLPLDLVQRITAGPRRYGVHATLKAPFRLRPTVSIDQVAQQLVGFARHHPSLGSGPLVLRDMNGFLALCPCASSKRLQALAHMLVIGFDEFRAPLDADDRSRRHADSLPLRKRILLELWGYPHVLSEFRFHITLTDRLGEAERAIVAGSLSAALDRAKLPEFEMKSLCLFGDPGGGKPFELVVRAPLLG